MKNKIEITLHNNDTQSFQYTDIKVIRTQQFNLISQVTIHISNDSYVIIKASNLSITLFTPSANSAYNNRLMQYSVKSITANKQTYNALSALTELSKFVKAFNIEQAIQQEFLKANNLAIPEQLICKSTEIMTASFLNQLENLGYVISDFTSQQREKLSSALLEFIEQTGDVLSQKSIFQKFVNTLNNNNKKG